MVKSNFSGKNLIDLPNNFSIVQLESDDLRPEVNPITEISVRKYKRNKLVDSYNEINVDKNSLESIEKFDNFIQNDPIIINYTSYFLPFICYAYSKYLNKSFSNDIIDIQRLFKRIEHQNRSKLDKMIKFFELDTLHDEIAKDDIISVEKIYFNLKDDFAKKQLSIEDIQPKHSSDFALKELTDNPELHDPEHLFFKKNVSASGKIDGYTRRDIAQMVKDIGGNFQKKPGKSTNYFILGELKKNEHLKKDRAKELNIETLGPDEFYYQANLYEAYLNK